MKLSRTLGVLLATAALACGTDDDATYVSGPGDADAASPTDSDVSDLPWTDAEPETDADIGVDATTEAGSVDATTDATTEAGIDGSTDATADGSTDATTDGSTEAGVDASTDASTEAGVDASTDTGTDTGVVLGNCISGAVGTHAVRFRWAGSGSGSTAYVVYEANQLPDTSRWRVRALSSNIGYTPVFTDVYLGEGGLDLGGTVFIDIELSTLGLSSVKNATIAVYGRSFHTTSSGSFTWQTFSGTGATPSGYVANSAPYEWYPADATAALPAGDGSTLLRLRAGPPSGRLVVNRVEICFDAE